MNYDIKRILERHSGFYENITVTLSESVSKSVLLNGKTVESIDIGSETGIVIRAFKEGRVVSQCADGLNTDNIDNFLSAHQNVIMSLPKDIHNIPFKPEYAEDFIQNDGNFASLTTSRMAELALEAVETAKAADIRVKSVNQSVISAAKESTRIITPFTNDLYSEKTYYSSYTYVVAAHRGEQDGYGFSDSTTLKGLDHIKAAEEAASAACTLLGAKKLKTGKYGVLFTPAVTSDFLDIIVELVNADNVYKKISMLGNRLGKSAASEAFTLFDDPKMRGGAGTRNFDDEGHHTGLTPIFANGILDSFLHNSYTASAMGMRNTANAEAGRGGSMEIGTSNLILKASTDKMPYDFMNEYVKVTEVMGMHTADTVSGDFSVGISGVLVRNGEAVHPFREAVLSGNLKDLLKGLVAVFEDYRTYAGVTSASALFDKMTVSGE
jgi:PmbA protein